MTSRRSLQSERRRSSRAFQFVPGHLGGRVASAQPVTKRGSIAAQIDPEEVAVVVPTIEWLFVQVDST